MKIALITMHAARNYGAVLQTYALQEYCERYGCLVEVIDYKRPNQTTMGYLLNINQKYQKDLLTKGAWLAKTVIPKWKTTCIFRDFLSRRIHLSKEEILTQDVSAIPKAEVYCVGSDQVWNPKANGGLDPMFFFYGVKGKKISYASSIGAYEVESSEQEKMKLYLQDFTAVSVREKSSVQLLQNMGIDAEFVLDPTLLLDAEDWHAFSDKEIVSHERYLLVYFFGNAKQIMETAKTIAKAKGLRICRIAVGFEKYAADELVERFVSPERFVALFEHADYIITNSFHGTIFSVNFGKEFLAYPVTENNVRFENVLALFSLQDRNLRKLDAECIGRLEPIDYCAVNVILQEQRHFSEQYLSNSLFNGEEKKN